ncbi:MAG: hypothetical protein FJY16_04170 [Bacteroidetes bacterium]|nr:hypothetical protein [Bacteroidota bacterium]
MKRIVLIFSICFLSFVVFAQNPRAVCNPMNLNYRFTLSDGTKANHREAADPSVVYYNNRYWLFASKSGGYWSSTNMIDWEFITPTGLPIEAYAPDVFVINDYFYYGANDGAGLYSTQNPLINNWTEVQSVYGGGDKHQFLDDDGHFYKFWGLSPNAPISVVELNPTTFEETGPKPGLFLLHSDLYGWEQRGEDHTSTQAGYLEGSWMTKHNGKYYLQYASPGTQFNIYNDGVYIANSPLGPYTIQRHNPYSYKPTGFMTSAGHGCSFYDTYGNLWHMTTMRISLRAGFERRLGLFPAGFDQDGVLFCNTRFGDYPMNMPTSKWNPWQNSFAGLMLLSLNKPVTVSSVRNNRLASYALDEDVRTYWAGQTKQNEWMQVDLGEQMSVAAFQVNLAEEECFQSGRTGTSQIVNYLVEGSANGSTWITLVDKSNFNQDLPHDFVRLSTPADIRYVKVKLLNMPGGGYCALSGFRVFGNKAGTPPGKVSSVTSNRLSDKRLMDVAWNIVAGAHGYNVFWGIEPNKLYNCMQVYGRNNAQIKALSVNETYYVAVEAFGETGVGVRSDVVAVNNSTTTSIKIAQSPESSAFSMYCKYP